MLLLMIIGLSASSSIELYTSNKYVIEFSCEENKELCAHCSADLIYKIEDKLQFEIQGHLSTTIDTIKELIQDLQIYLQADEWFLSLDSQNFCFDLKKIENKPDFSGLLKNFLNLQYSDYKLPEIDQNSELEQIFVITEVGASSKYLTSSIKVDYSISSSFLVADEVNLKGTKKRLDLFQGQGLVFYSGVAETSVLSPRFQVSFPYGTIPNQVQLTILTKSEVLLSSWYSATFSNAGCQDVASPRGLDSVHHLAVNRSLLTFAVSSSLTLETFSNQVFPPDFSTAPGISLYQVQAFMTVNGGKCGLLVQALWDNGKVWNSSLYAGELEEFYLNARLMDSPFELKVSEYSEILNSFYEDFSGIFPRFLNNSSMIDTLEDLVLENPLMVLKFDPEANAELSSLARLKVSNDVEVFLNTFRRNSVIQTLGEVKCQNVYDLFSIQQLSDPEFYLESTHLGLDGVNLNVNLSMSLNCNNSVLCLALEESLNSSVLSNLTGFYFPDDFYVRQIVETVELAGLEVSSAEVLINFTESSVNANGTCLINLGSQELTLYECFIRSEQELAHFYAVQDKEFKGMPGSSNLFLFYSELLQGVNYEKIVYDQVVGLCGFKGIDDRWSGDLQLELTGYQTEKYACDLRYAPMSTIVKYLVGMTEPDALILLLDFPYGLTLRYEEDFTIEESLTILGLSSKASLKTPYLPNILKFSLSTHDFYTSHGNIQFSSVSGILEVYSTYSKCEFKGIFSLWEVSQSSKMSISSDSMSFSITGSPFNGPYNTTLHLSASLQTLDAAEWTASFDINSSYIEALSISINSSLASWVAEGQSTLEEGLLLVYSWQDLVETSSSLVCQDDCGSRLYCTSKLTEQCTEKAMIYLCSDEISSCDPEIVCKGYGMSCLNEDCSESVYYCEEYLENCAKSNNSQCVSQSLAEIGIECLKTQFMCSSQSYQEESCRSWCKFYSDINSYYRRCFEMVNASYYSSLQDMQGFWQMSDQQLFEIFQISGEVALDQSGIGVNDIQVLVEFRAWKDGSFENLSEYIKWDFKNDQTNKETLYSLIKSSIVKKSHSLTDDLVDKTPEEVYSESLFQVE